MNYRGDDEDEEYDEKEQKQITFKTILTNPRAMMAAVSSIFAMVFMLFIDTIYSVYLVKEAGVGEDYIGYVFALGCGVYSIFSPIVGILCKYIPKLFLTQFAFIMSFISLILLGPSIVLNIGQDHKGIYSIIGNGVLGFAVSFIFVPLLSEIVDAVKEKEGLTEESEKLNDLASGVFNASYSIGCLIAPILGGLFNDLYGFQYTCDIMAFASLIYAGIYFIFNVVPYIITHYALKKDKRLADAAEKEKQESTEVHTIDEVPDRRS